jgi:2-polyprenyl-3-methyl-5-hydroxy-6-metoxy-1,4-benzoquinol methylase
MDAEDWNERYRASSAVWSGEPNAALVEHAPPPPAPGARAVDLGCGEGADALWLARQGWAVTAVDWAGVALNRVRDRVAQAGLPVTVAQGDATDAAFVASLSPTGRYDLVTLGYLHPEPEDRSRTYAHLAGLLEPGGHLLVITHAPAHGRLGLPGPPPHRLLGGADVLAALGTADLEVLVADDVQRLADDGAVRAVDAVVLVRRGT